MGFFDDNEGNGADALLDQQLRESQAELEAKKQSLYQTRLDIIKGQGGQNWSPNYEPPSFGKSSSSQTPFSGAAARSGVSNRLSNNLSGFGFKTPHR
jgi:hypothetical protein